MKRILIHNATLVNEGREERGSLIIEGDHISDILTADVPIQLHYDELIEATGCYLLPGVIDEHVHFREPGLTHKADILSESRAAAAGGVTSIMDMPNTFPMTVTLKALEEKQRLLEKKCIVNHSCYFGATNDNYKLLAHLDAQRVCGVKLFMGASTGNMLVDQADSLRHIFESSPILIAAHCEDQEVINRNAQRYAERFGGADRVPMSKHYNIRSGEACFNSTKTAVRMAQDTRARLHVMHISTARELGLFSEAPLSSKKLITAEACIGHLIFDQKDVQRLGTRIKCNPSIKRRSDANGLIEAINAGRIDTIATDHAPHLLTDKEGGALTAASGMPLIQFSLVSMLNLVDDGLLTITKVVEKMCHAPAQLYQIDRRGFLRKGYKADLVLVRPGAPWILTDADIRSKCGWSPFEGETFRWRVEKTFANGHLIYDNGQVDMSYRGEALRFVR